MLINALVGRNIFFFSWPDNAFGLSYHKEKFYQAFVSLVMKTDSRLWEKQNRKREFLPEGLG